VLSSVTRVASVGCMPFCADADSSPCPLASSGSARLGYRGCVLGLCLSHPFCSGAEAVQPWRRFGRNHVSEEPSLSLRTVRAGIASSCSTDGASRCKRGKAYRQASLRVTLTSSEAECGKKAGRGAEPVPEEEHWEEGSTHRKFGGLSGGARELLCRVPDLIQAAIGLRAH
jgi:hypothetical protein